MSHMVAYVDGGSRGRRGPAGVGVVIEHSTGHRVEISECIGSSDNNYAEYAALLIALHYAVAAECCRLQVFSDSEVVVRQISGSYTCQSAALRRIHEICKRLISSFDHFTITHIRRESNSQADRLAKAAMDRAHRRSRSEEDLDQSEPSWFESAMSHTAESWSPTGAPLEA